MNVDDRLRDVEIQLARVKQRVDDHEGDIQQRFANLPTELHELRWDQAQMVKSLDAAHAALREVSGEIQQVRQMVKDAREERQQQLAEIEHARLEAEKKQIAMNIELRDRDEQRRSENRRNLYVLAGVFLAAVGQVLSGLFGGGPTP